MIGALLRPVERRWNPVRIAQKKIRGVHQRVVLLLRSHSEAPQCRFRERVAHRPLFVGVIAHRPVIKVFLNEQDLRAAALKAHDARRAKLPTVQPNIIRTDPRRKPALVQKFAAPFVDFEPELPLLCIPVKVEITRKFLGARGFLSDRGRLRRFGPSSRYTGRRRNHENGEKPARKLRHIQTLQRR